MMITDRCVGCVLGNAHRQFVTQTTKRMHEIRWLCQFNGHCLDTKVECTIRLMAACRKLEEKEEKWNDQYFSLNLNAGCVPSLLNVRNFRCLPFSCEMRSDNSILILLSHQRHTTNCIIIFLFGNCGQWVGCVTCVVTRATAVYIMDSMQGFWPNRQA